MGIRVGRIVKEFVFKNLMEREHEIVLHAGRKELTCALKAVDEKLLELEIKGGEQETLNEGEEIQAFFYFQNNHHTFSSTIVKLLPEARLKIQHPEFIYKNPQRKYERIRPVEETEAFFTLKGQSVELNFPKTGRFLLVEEGELPLHDSLPNLRMLIRQFREKIREQTSENRISMLRNRTLKGYEEKLLAATGKILWIPSTEEDFPLNDPFPDERILTKRELIRYEESFNTAPYVITSKLGNLLYGKQKRRIYSEVWCPILYNEYLVGILYVANREEKRERISADFIDYLYQFSKVLSFSLKHSGYFATPTGEERLFKAPIIDISAAGLLFAHPLEDLGKELLIHTDLKMVIRFPGQKIEVNARVRRKFHDENLQYFGLQFLKIEPKDFSTLFERLYGRPPTAEDTERWEGGSPPPTLDLFAESG